KSRYMLVRARGCDNGAVSWDVRDSNNAPVHRDNINIYSDYVRINKISDDLSITARCALNGATESCKEVSITSEFPFVDCNDVSMFWKSATREGFIDIYEIHDEQFMLTGEDGNTYTSSPGVAGKQNVVQLPMYSEPKIYHVSFHQKNCTMDIEIPPVRLQIYSMEMKGDVYVLPEMPVDRSRLLTTTNFGQSKILECNGQIVWTNDRDESSVTNNILIF